MYAKQLVRLRQQKTKSLGLSAQITSTGHQMTVSGVGKGEERGWEGRGGEGGEGHMLKTSRWEGEGHTLRGWGGEGNGRRGGGREREEGHMLKTSAGHHMTVSWRGNIIMLKTFKGHRMIILAHNYVILSSAVVTILCLRGGGGGGNLRSGTFDKGRAQ